jgi:hypothetical protein
MTRKRQKNKPNYALKGDVTCEFFAPSDMAALSKAQSLVVRGPIGVSKLFFTGPSVDELLAVLEKTDSVLCKTTTAAS